MFWHGSSRLQLEIIIVNECCNINEIFNGFYTHLIAFVQKRVQDSDAANDIVQEVFLKLAVQHEKSVEIRNVKAWIFQVTRNVLSDYYAKQQKELKFFESFSQEALFSEELLDKSANDSLLEMINALPKDYGVPLYLSDIEQLPQKEIAEKLDLGLSATKMRIQRGREKLRALFIKCCDIEYDSFGNFISCTRKPGCKLGS